MDSMTNRGPMAKMALPIFGYHHVLPSNAEVDAEVLNSPFMLSRRDFYHQMAHLAQQDFRAMLLDDLLKLQNGGVSQQEKHVAITFDDGWADNYQHAFPILESFDLRATFFVITSRIDTAGYLSWDELRQMQQAGMEIQSHTHSHVPLELLTAVEVEMELRLSKEILEDRLERPVTFISFPHGSYTQQVIAATKRAGYLACGTSNVGYFGVQSSLFELPRNLIRKNEDIGDFRRLCVVDRPLIFRRQVAYRSKALLKDVIGLESYMNLHRRFYKTGRQQLGMKPDGMS